MYEKAIFVAGYD